MSHRRESQFSSVRKVDVTLVGNPPYGLLLGNVLWDLGAFRPDPRNHMRIGKSYSSWVQTETESLLSGEEVQVPREVEIISSRYRFINTR